MLALTGLFFVISVAVGAQVFSVLKSGNDFEDPASQSAQTRGVLERAAGRQVGVGLVALVRTRTQVASDPTTRARVQAIGRTIAADPAVAGVASFYGTHQPTFVSHDGTATYVVAIFRNLSDQRVADAGKRLQTRLERTPEVSVGGPALSGPAIGTQVGQDIGMAEGLAFPILFLLSLIFFRGLVAALLPLFVGVITIFGAFFLLRMVSVALPLSIFALNLVIALGLGLAIDYSLFIVSRYREELVRAGPGRAAIRRTLATAGRTVTFSALTVAAALASLLIFPQRFLYSMGLGGVLVTLVALATSLTALPALLVVLGPRVNAVSPARWRRAIERTARQEQVGGWYRIAQAVTRRPALIALLSAVVLIAAGLPALGIKFTGASASDLPSSSAPRRVDDALSRQFPPNRTSPIEVAIRSPPGDQRRVSAYARGLASLPGAAAVGRPRYLGRGVWQADVVPRYAPLDDRSQALVRTIRSRGAPFPIGATGETAAFVDQQASLASHLPLGMLLLAGLTVTILFLLTGSVVLPLKSLLMNVLTLSAAFGLLVLIFQDGHLQGLLGFTSQGALESTQPILLAVLVFGLSTDYAVFLLARIKEAHDSGLENRQAVAIGLERTGRIVSAAALLFCVAIGAFATSKIIFIKEVGVGTALAVIIDATIIRALLVPSLMALLGDRNWWAPAALRRLHERLGFGESRGPNDSARLSRRRAG
jgi:RND superfamily putative drug exporter